MELIIRHDNNQICGDWLKEGLGNEYSFEFKTIPDPGSPEFLNLPEKIKNVLKLDKPDLIISRRVNDRETPIIIIEITHHKPVSQHIEQRMVRVIAAAEQGVAAIYITPELVMGSKKKDGKYVPARWPFNTKHFELMYKIGNINKVPTIFFYYPTKDGIILDDMNYPDNPKINTDESKKIFYCLSNLLQETKNINDINFSFFNNKVVNNEFSKQISLAKKKYEINTNANSTHEIVPTKKLKEYLISKKFIDKFPSNKKKNIDWVDKTFDNLPNRIVTREDTLILKPKLNDSRLFNHSGDPYVGMLGSFDYAFCRWGPNIEDRKMNLIFVPQNKDDAVFSKVFANAYNSFYNKKNSPFKKDNLAKIEDQFKVAHHLQYGSTFTKNRPLKIYSHFCDLIVFKDGILVF